MKIDKPNLFSTILVLISFFLFFSSLHSFAQSLYCPKEPDCSGHGSCDPSTPTICDCDTGWQGEYCSNPAASCRNNCSNHGSCNSDGSCSCYLNWSGSDCSISCPTNCIVHGFCDGAGGCICDTGYSGSDCSVFELPTPTPTLTPTPTPQRTPKPTSSPTSCQNNCSDHGFCTKYGCICDQGYSSIDCSISCPNKCSGHGICIDGACSCDSGWSGSNDCAVRSSDEETSQIIGDIMRNVAFLDIKTLQNISEGDYPSALPIIDQAIKSLISARDTVANSDEFTVDSESKLDRLLKSSINNLKKAHSYIESIVNDPKARLSRLLKEAKEKIKRSLFTSNKAEDAVNELILGDGNSP